MLILVTFAGVVDIISVKHHRVLRFRSQYKNNVFEDLVDVDHVDVGHDGYGGKYPYQKSAAEKVFALRQVFQCRYFCPLCRRIQKYFQTFGSGIVCDAA